MLQGGGAVVVWWDTGDFDPRASAVRAQVYDRDGNPVGSEITVDAPTNAFVDGEPSVAPLNGGGFVVGWSPYPNAELGTPSYVAMQVYDAGGQPQGSQIVISNPSRFQTDIELAPTASGGFLAVWSDNATDVPGAENGDTRAQFYDVSGSPLGASFVVNTGSDQDLRDAEVTLLSSGNYLITWLNPRPASDGSKEIVVRAQIIAPDGTKVGGEFAPITDADGVNHMPQFAPLDEGGFAAVWVDNGVPNGPEGVVKLQFFNADGTPRTGTFDVGNTLVATNEVVLTDLEDGNVAVGFASTISTNLEGDLTIFTYAPDGTVLSGPNFVNGTNGAFYFDIDGLDRDDIVVTYTEGNAQQSSPTGSNEDIFVQTLGLDRPGVTLQGTGNSERLIGTQGNDLINGGSGFDTILGGLGADTLDGGDKADQIYGGFGDDSLEGGSGADALYGEAGDDTLNSGDEADRLYGGTGNDLLFGGWAFGTTVDGLWGDEGNDTLYGETGYDLLDGGEGDDLLDGGDQADNLYGQSGNDTLGGGAGFDTLIGGTGNDLLLGNFNADRFVFEDGHGADVIGDFDALNVFEQIDLRNVSAITDLTDLTDNHMSQVGVNVVIDTGAGNSITLNSVNIADLDSTDFIF
jgi:Ca2+-binding RTX toxin-like protein